MPRFPGGVATGIGSLPGTDVAEAVRTVFGELPDFAYLPELPERGPGADMVGRTCAMLVDLPVTLYAGRWQTSARHGIDVSRATDFLERDLDTLTDLVSEHDGAVKIAACGPWTLAASLQRARGGPMLADPGATRELTQSLAEGLARYAAQVAARMPHASVFLQLDEPSLPAVLAGGIATPSGFSRYAPVEVPDAIETLTTMVNRAGVPVVAHCCAGNVPVRLLQDAGVAAISLDLSLLDLNSARSLDPIGEAVEAGVGLIAGALDATAWHEPPSPKSVADSVQVLWNRLGFSAAVLREQVCISPSCGTAEGNLEQARVLAATCVEAMRRFTI